jgi:hypothetical protein
VGWGFWRWLRGEEAEEEGEEAGAWVAQVKYAAGHTCFFYMEVTLLLVGVIFFSQ